MKPASRANPIHAFFQWEAAGGVLLMLAALLALILANSAWQDAYHGGLARPFAIGLGEWHIAKPLLLWINDGLMAVFFLLVALEIKREALVGQLSSRARLMLPLVCAAGGVAVPATIYVLFNADDPVARHGWAIPAATDIAFALGVLSLLGSRVPLALKVLLSAIAVIDDLVAIVIIAIFYTAELSWFALGGAALTLAAMIVLNRYGVRRVWPYLALGLVLWVFVLKSGVHATLAGVATGLLIPLGDADGTRATPFESFERRLHPWVAYAILPIFAFANAGLSLAGIGISSALQPVPLGIALGLLFGKPIGVLAAAALALAAGWARRPDGVSWSALAGMGLLCGIGFTMSLFIGSLAFGLDATAQEATRLGILLGSTIAAIAGLAWLHLALPRRTV